ncbi:MAG TPA: hypothetical protein VFB08_10165 [Burkholderiales bacterium]|nr:hypothetical protein [Burkholderiales bacterium]
MNTRLVLSTIASALLAACASVDIGHGLVPGQSMQSDVEASLGRPADVRKLANGETELWYPQMPYGFGSYAARIAPDGRLIALEQRLTEQTVGRIVPNKTTAGEVLDLVGPPYRKDPFPRMEREIWTYKFQSFPAPKALFVQLSADDLVREVYLMDDPEVPRLGAGSPP